MNAQVLFVIVIYKTTLENSTTYQSLVSAFKSLAVECPVYCFDNTPGAAVVDRLDGNVRYVSIGNNVGLARPYNLAFDYARSKGYQAVVTLDQDSVVTQNYLSAVVKWASEINVHSFVALPDVYSGNRLLSPFSQSRMGLMRYGEKTATHAINSFSVYAVDAVGHLGGFDEFYWLDGLDYSTYERIQRIGGSVERLEVSVGHDLSIVGNSLPSAFRCSNIIYFEACFFAEFCSGFKLFGGLFRAFVRAIKFALRGRSFAFATCLGAFFNGLRQGIKRRRTVL